MSGEIITTSGRDATTIAIEIRTIHTNAMTSLMVAAVEIGRRLVEAKQLVAHGDWGDYIANQVGYSHSQCNNYMRLYNEYGDHLNSQSIGNLEPTKALALLALPAEERESFATDHQAENLSVAQLKAEIKKHQQRADDAEVEAASAASKAIAAQDTVLSLQGKLRDKQSDVDGLRKQNADVTRENRELKAKLAAAENKPGQISAEQAEQIRAKVRAQVEQQLREEFKLAEAEAGQQIDELLAKSVDLAKRNAELEKQLAEKPAAAPAAVPVLAQSDKELIQELFSGIGERFNKLAGLLIKSEEKAPEVAAIIRRMAKAQIQNVAKAFGLEVTVA